MTSKNDTAHLQYYIKLCASFQIHRWIQKLSETLNSDQIGDFLSRVTLKFDGWPWKTTGHLFYVASSFVHHSIAISEFKLELQSGNAQFGSKSMIFFSRVTLNLTDDLEKNRAPLLSNIKLCASFHHHIWIQTGVTVRKHPIWVKIDDFLAVWPWNLTSDLNLCIDVTSVMGLLPDTQHCGLRMRRECRERFPSSPTPKKTAS